MAEVIGGHYQFDRTTDEIGVGGMGSVFRAVDTQTGDRVAIKQLKIEIANDSDFVERFEREAEALRRLNHPNIVDVLETVREGDNHYIIMEYVSGGTLADMLEEVPNGLKVERTLEIALDLADALTRAHRVGIIHRDIKPANVLIADDGTPRLTDFGVAQIDDKTRVTKTGSVVGTLNYLSPEALNGLVLDERTDIWAFGVLLYEMLTGERPFDEETTTGLITAILTKPLPDIREKRPDVPDVLADLLSQMLMKELEDRLSSVRKVGGTLEDIIRGADSDEIDLHDAVPTDPKHSRFARATSEPSASALGAQRVVSDTGEEYMMVPVRSLGNLRLLAVGGFIIILLVFVIGAFLLAEAPDEDDERPPANFGPPVDLIEPIQDDEYLVLVVPFDNLGTAEDRDVSRFIAADLTQKFEQEIPFSNIRVRVAPTSIGDIDIGSGSRALAQALLNRVQPSMIVWGTYDDERVLVNVQVGSTAMLPYNQFEDNTLARTANIMLEMEQPREQTLAPYVAGALGVIHSADGDVFELMRIMTILQELDPSDLEVITDTDTLPLAAQVALFFDTYIDDPTIAVEAMTNALDRDGGNPLLYSYRAFAYFRLGEVGLMFDDITTAQRIGPDNWAFPEFLKTLTPFLEAENIFLAEMPDINNALAMRPDDWFFLFFAAEAAYSQGDFEDALFYVEEALINEPELNVVHLIGILIAMHEGRLSDAGALLDEMVRLFPDPNFSTQLIYAVLGEDLGSGAAIYSAFANLFVGQYQRVLGDTQALFQIIPEIDRSILENIGQNSPGDVYLVDLVLARGIAMCATDDLESSLVVFELAASLDPDYALVYVLAADVASRTGHPDEALEIIDYARGFSDELDSFIDVAIENEDIDCSTFFDNFINGWEIQ